MPKPRPKLSDEQKRGQLARDATRILKRNGVVYADAVQFMDSHGSERIGLEREDAVKNLFMYFRTEEARNSAAGELRERFARAKVKQFLVVSSLFEKEGRFPLHVKAETEYHGLTLSKIASEIELHSLFPFVRNVIEGHKTPVLGVSEIIRHGPLSALYFKLGGPAAGAQKTPGYSIPKHVEALAFSGLLDSLITRRRGIFVAWIDRRTHGMEVMLRLPEHQENTRLLSALKTYLRGRMDGHGAVAQQFKPEPEKFELAALDRKDARYTAWAIVSPYRLSAEHALRSDEAYKRKAKSK